MWHGAFQQPICDGQGSCFYYILLIFLADFSHVNDNNVGVSINCFCDCFFIMQPVEPMFVSYCTSFIIIASIFAFARKMLSAVVAIFR